MGVFLFRHDPATTDALRRNMEFLEIFEEAGWMEYFERLIRFHEIITLQFSQNMVGDHFEVEGLRIDVSEHVLAEVTGLTTVGKRWFVRKVFN